jgi:ketosteroid isomerase-like protein
MMRSVCATLILSSLCLLAAAANAQSGQGLANDPEKQAVITRLVQQTSIFNKLVDQYYAAWNSGDPEKAAPLYAKDPNLVFYDITPLKYTGWKEYEAGVRGVMSSFASVSFTPRKDLSVTVSGSVAWTTLTFHMSGKKKTGESVEVDGRHTIIWENRGGKWLIVHEHFSVPLS